MPLPVKVFASAVGFGVLHTCSKVLDAIGFKVDGKLSLLKRTPLISPFSLVNHK